MLIDTLTMLGDTLTMLGDTLPMLGGTLAMLGGTLAMLGGTFTDFFYSFGQDSRLLQEVGNLNWANLKIQINF
ncbi:hypothetical protein [Anabaena sp. CCY 9402-a]|uniref:hypothetical protein n=1 Tax=Anabaena sp. CCY 9402-a TaxID=3103867 RepID=UPI0039C62AB0